MTPNSVCDNCVRECQWRAPSGGLDPPVITCSRIIQKPQTNYERIIKTPEVLAAFISSHAACPVAVFDKFPECTIDEECAPRKCWVKWLKQEAHDG